MKYVGLSEVGPSLIRRAHAIHPLTCVEQEWSLWSRDIESSIVPVCKDLGIGVLAYSPLGRGFLTGALTKEAVNELGATDFRRVAQPRLQVRTHPRPWPMRMHAGVCGPVAPCVHAAVLFGGDGVSVEAGVCQLALRGVLALKV